MAKVNNSATNINYCDLQTIKKFAQVVQDELLKSRYALFYDEELGYDYNWSGVMTSAIEEDECKRISDLTNGLVSVRFFSHRDLQITIRRQTIRLKASNRFGSHKNPNTQDSEANNPYLKSAKAITDIITHSNININNFNLAKMTKKTKTIKTTVAYTSKKIKQTANESSKVVMGNTTSIMNSDILALAGKMQVLAGEVSNTINVKKNQPTEEECVEIIRKFESDIKELTGGRVIITFKKGKKEGKYQVYFRDWEVYAQTHLKAPGFYNVNSLTTILIETLIRASENHISISPSDSSKTEATIKKIEEIAEYIASALPTFTSQYGLYGKELFAEGLNKCVENSTNGYLSCIVDDQTFSLVHDDIRRIINLNEGNLSLRIKEAIYQIIKDVKHREERKRMDALTEAEIASYCDIFAQAA